VSTGGQDLFVVCKSCGSEVSPYITECPYCGNRLRKRAPKLDRDQRVAERRQRRTPTPLLTRLRRDEIPGIRPDRRPYVTLALLVAGFIGSLLWRTGLGGVSGSLLVYQPLSVHFWHVFTAAFAYGNTGYAFVTLGAITLYGWLLERRHGPVPVVLLFLLGGVGGLAATAELYTFPIALGAQGAALAVIVAWAIPDLLTLRRGEDVEGDLLGTLAIAAVVALMPLAGVDTSWVADGVGLLAGLVVGLPLARLSAA
jgi:membrane associated rhomboid family serine protease